MFLSNKYTTWYYNLVEKSRRENRKKTRTGTYYERHHIIPRSLKGSNDSSNLIFVTPKEHYICHLLLTKMVEGKNKQKMAYALWNMSNCTGTGRENRHKLNARQYSRIRDLYIKSAVGRKNHTEEYKQYLREKGWQGRLKHGQGEDNHEFRGYYHTPWGKFATRQAASNSCEFFFSAKRVAKACKENERIVWRTRISEPVPQEWVGKSYKELGFWFEEVDK